MTDIPGVTRIVARALHSLGWAEAAILTNHVQARTGIGSVAARALLKDAETYREQHGFLRTPRQVADAYLRLLKQYHEEVVMVGSSLYTYALSTSLAANDETVGFFDRTPHENLIEHLIDAFDDLPLLRTPSARAEVLVQLRLQCGDDNFFADARAGVNLRNGFLQMDEAGQITLIPHSPNHKARMRLQVDYDADADSSWLEAAFALTLPDSSARRTLQEVAGSILFRVRPVKDNVRGLCFLYGASGSGKSTIIEMLKGLLPPDVVGSVPPEHWGDPNYRAALENLVLNVVTELGTTRLAGEHVKKIVSCEPIIARKMRNNPFTFTPIAQHLFAGNEVPRISDTTNAFARRINVITFEQTIAEGQVDSGLLERVKANPNALLAFAATGATRLRQQGVFTTPPGHDLAIAEMQHGHDPSLLFAHTQVRKDPNGRVTTVALRNALIAFASERDMRVSANDDGAIRKVARVLYDKHGAQRCKVNGNPFYKGVSLITGAQPEVERTSEVGLDDL